MESFRWDPCFVTGLPVVDEQHHRLVDLINHFGERVTGQEGASFEEMRTVLADLIAYAEHHFRDEEDFMASVGVDPRLSSEQGRSHTDFLGEVIHVQAGLTPGNTGNATKLHAFLVHWLAHHILGSDQSMARQIAAIQAGATATEAYAAEARARACATDPLLHALDGLFHQLTERNQDLVRLNQTLEAKVAERTRALEEANRKLEDAANTDLLTGLPNRRHALNCFEREWQSSSQTGVPFACMMVDADHFKEINDTYGHDAGDEVLRRLARQLRYSVRTDDIVCRLGGDEFLILCPRTSLEGAMQLAEQVRAAVASLRVPAGTGAWTGSISAGVAARRSGIASVEELMKVADEGVYVAKRKGRDAVATIQRRLRSEAPPPSRRKRAAAGS